jgi:hypothetical protein
MSVNIDQLRESTIEAVMAILKQQYQSGDPEGMKPFATAIAQAAVSAVSHVVANAQTVSGEGIR